MLVAPRIPLRNYGKHVVCAPEKRERERGPEKRERERERARKFNGINGREMALDEVSLSSILLCPSCFITAIRERTKNGQQY